MLIFLPHRSSFVLITLVSEGTAFRVVVLLCRVLSGRSGRFLMYRWGVAWNPDSVDENGRPGERQRLTVRCWVRGAVQPDLCFLSRRHASHGEYEVFTFWPFP